MDFLDWLWNVDQDSQIKHLHQRFDKDRLERDLTSGDLALVKQLVEENQGLKLRLGLLLRLLISKGVITAPEFSAMLAEVTIVTSSFFDVSTVGDVTVIKLKDAVGQHRDHSNKVDLKTLIHQVREPTQPLAIELWQQFRHDLLLLLDTEKPRKVVLDFGGLHRIGHQPVISTAMNSVYVSARNHSSRFGCQWRLCGLAEDLRTIFAFCPLSKIFPDLHETQSEAVATFSPAATEPT